VVLIRLKSSKQDFSRTLTLAAFSFSLIRSLTENSAKPVLDVEGTGGKSETRENTCNMFQLFYERNLKICKIKAYIPYRVPCSNRKNLHEKM